MTFPRKREFEVKPKRTEKDIFNAKVAITKEITQYARQISIDITRLATDSIRTDGHYNRRGKKYG